MGVTCTAEGRALRAAVSGEVDHHGAKEIMAELEKQLDTRLPKNLTLDLGGVSFMDSSGIAVLLRAQRRMQALGGRVQVEKTPPQAMKVLHAAGLERIIEFI